MRLLLVSNDYPPKLGGIQQYLGGLVDAYPHPTRVLAPADQTAAPDPNVVRHHASFMWPTRSVGAWIQREIFRFKPDAVVFGAPWPLPLLGPRLRSATGLPYGVIVHGAEVSMPAAIPGLRQAVLGPLRRADTVLAVNPYTAGLTERLAHRSVTVLGTGVGAGGFAPRFEPRNGRAVVGCVGRFVPRKGQHRLIDAVATIRSEGQEAEVLLVGGGRMEQSLRRRAERLGVPTRFEVDVPWDSLGGLYREMDVFAMPARTRWFGLEMEGFGLVYLEAAATGLPVIAGDSGGAPLTVVPGRTGFVVHSQADLVEALELLLSNPDRAAAMGESGRERVLTEYAWTGVVERLEAAISALH
jgi:phosphatidylinositol alpha-1,6-mannosyltransferase